MQKYPKVCKNRLASPILLFTHAHDHLISQTTVSTKSVNAPGQLGVVGEQLGNARVKSHDTVT